MVLSEIRKYLGVGTSAKLRVSRSANICARSVMIWCPLCHKRLRGTVVVSECSVHPLVSACFKPSVLISGSKRQLLWASLGMQQRVHLISRINASPFIELVASNFGLGNATVSASVDADAGRPTTSVLHGLVDRNRFLVLAPCGLRRRLWYSERNCPITPERDTRE